MGELGNLSILVDMLTGAGLTMKSVRDDRQLHTWFLIQPCKMTVDSELYVGIRFIHDLFEI